MYKLIKKQIIISMLLALTCLLLIIGMIIQGLMIRQLKEDNELALESIKILQKAVITIME